LTTLVSATHRITYVKNGYYSSFLFERYLIQITATTICVTDYNAIVANQILIADRKYARDLNVLQ
jgi:hypothetical protein